MANTTTQPLNTSHLPTYRTAPQKTGFLWSMIREYGKDPLAFYRNLALKGDFVEFEFGPEKMYFLNHPEYVQHVLQRNNRNYKRNAYSNELLKLFLRESLLTLDGDSWLSQRRLMQPMFHRKRLAFFSDTMVNLTVEMLDEWQEKVEKQESFDLRDEMMSLTLRIAGLTLFNVELRHDTQGIGQAVTEGNEFLNDRMRSFFHPPLWLPTPSVRRFKQATKRLDELVYQIIRDRRQQTEQPDDLLAMLMEARDQDTGEGMNDEQLRNEIVTMIVAGHETTANALTWALALVALHPHVEEKLHNELRDVLDGRPPTMQDLPNLPYSKMVIDEAIRLYPPAWAISRQSINEDEIDGYHIKANAGMIMITNSLHRHPKLWHNPEHFDPERFNPERSSTRHKYSYFPFGGGPQLCIGKTFALIEAQLVLASIAQRYWLRLLPNKPLVPEPMVTLRPRHEVMMKAYVR